MRARGIVETSPGRIALRVCDDFSRYYRQLIYWEFPNLIGGLALPAHGCHVTIGQPKLHVIDQARADKWHGTPVNFTYGPIYIGGFRAGHVGFYMKVYSGLLDIIKKDVIIQEPGDSSFHISVCSSKGFKKYFLTP